MSHRSCSQRRSPSRLVPKAACTKPRQRDEGQDQCSVNADSTGRTKAKTGATDKLRLSVPPSLSAPLPSNHEARLFCGASPLPSPGLLSGTHCSQRGPRQQPKGLTPTAPSSRTIRSRPAPAPRGGARPSPAPRGATVYGPRRKPRGTALVRQAPKGRKCHRVSPSAPSGLPADRPGPTGFAPVAIDLRPLGTVGTQPGTHRRCPARELPDSGIRCCPEDSSRGGQETSGSSCRAAAHRPIRTRLMEQWRKAGRRGTTRRAHGDIARAEATRLGFGDR